MSLRKTFWKRHKMFAISLGMASAISLWHFFQGVLAWQNIPYGIPENAYISWMGGSQFFPQTFWFYMCLPLLVSISVCVEYGISEKNHYFLQYKLRMGRKKYAWQKGKEIFLLGAMVCVIPLLLNFALTMLVRPLLLPSPLVAVGPSSATVCADFYYTRPFLYTLFYIGFDGIFSGTVAIFSCLLCMLVENYFLASLIPFAIYYALDTMSGFLQKSNLSIREFLIPVNGMMDWGCLWSILLVGVGMLFWWNWMTRRQEG